MVHQSGRDGQQILLVDQDMPEVDVVEEDHPLDMVEVMVEIVVEDMEVTAFNRSYCWFSISVAKATIQ